MDHFCRTCEVGLHLLDPFLKHFSLFKDQNCDIRGSRISRSWSWAMAPWVIQGWSLWSPERVGLRDHSLNWRHVVLFKEPHTEIQGSWGLSSWSLLNAISLIREQWKSSPVVVKFRHNGHWLGNLALSMNDHCQFQGIRSCLLGSYLRHVAFFHGSCLRESGTLDFAFCNCCRLELNRALRRNANYCQSDTNWPCIATNGMIFCHHFNRFEVHQI